MNKKERIYMGFVYLVGALVLGLLLFFMLRSAGCLDESRLFLPSDVTSFRLQNDGHDFSFSRTGDSWKSANDETFPVDPQKAEAFLEFMAGLPVTKKLSKDADPSSYGLSEPACILTLTLKNGKEKVIRTGGAGEKEGEYCFTFSDKASILLTSGDLSGMGTLSEYDLIALTKAPEISNQDVTRIRIENHTLGTVADICRYPDLRPDIDLSETYTWFITFPDGFERPANEDNIPYLLAATEGIRYEYCIGWNVNDAYLSACGFDDPEMEVTIVWNDGSDRSLDLILSGSTPGGAHYYAREKDGRNVYLIPASVGIFFESAVPDTMTSMNPGYVGMSYLSSYQARVEEHEFSGSIIRSGGNTRYELNGKDVPQYDFTILYASLFDFYGSCAVTESGTKAGKIVYSLEIELEGHEVLHKLLYELREYDEAHYAFSTNGRIWMLVDKERLSEMKDAVEKQLPEGS